MFLEIGFDTTKLDETFDVKLKQLLNKMKEKAEKKINEEKRSRSISQKKVKEFKHQVLRGFCANAHMRKIMIRFKLYKYKTKDEIGKSLQLQINKKIDNKALFFDEWIEQSDNHGRFYGYNLAGNENLELIKRISENCKEISIGNFEGKLREFENLENIVIIRINNAFYQFFDSLENYIPKGKITSKVNDKITKLKSFDKYYNFKGHLIPIFNILEVPNTEKQILILDKTKIGKLVQYSPLNDREDTNLVKDIFYIDVQELTKNEQLMAKLVKNPSEWRQEKGEKEEQLEYLQELVHIQIFENFEYIKPKDFKGYKLFVKDNPRITNL